MGLKHCIYVVWTPFALRHFHVEYNDEYFTKEIVPACQEFLNEIMKRPKCPNMTMAVKSTRLHALYEAFPECDPDKIVRIGPFVSEAYKINSMQVHDLP